MQKGSQQTQLPDASRPNLPPPAEQLQNAGEFLASLALEELHWELFQHSLMELA